MTPFIEQVKAKYQLIEASPSPRLREIEAKYEINAVEWGKLVKDFTKRIISGLLGVVLLATTANGMTIKNGKAVADSMQKRLDKAHSGYKVSFDEQQVTNDLQGHPGKTRTHQAAEFTLSKNGQRVGALNFSGWDLDRHDPDRDLRWYDNVLTLSMGNTKDDVGHLALLVLKRVLEVKAFEGQDVRDYGTGTLYEGRTGKEIKMLQQHIVQQRKGAK